MNSYTFHISLPGYGRVWRKIELTEEATLADLHNSIQAAYDFDNDHLYSFFMSGKAWDSDTEYCLPEDTMPFRIMGATEFDENGNAIASEGDEEEFTPAEAEMAQLLSDLPEPPEPDALESLETPTPEQMRDMFTELKNNPEARDQFLEAMATQMGLPPAMAQMMLGNLDQLFTGMSDQDLEALLTMDVNALGTGGLGAGTMSGIMGGGFMGGGEAGDVQTATLASLNLRKGKKFLYLFDYGDEWRFEVKVHTINKNADPSLAYPRLVEAVGEAPPQYESWDEDEEWDEE